MNQNFPKKNKIRKSHEYRKVQQGAKKKHSRYFTLLYKQGRSRIGITVSTQVGNSPQRNYIKRCVREFYRKNKHLFTGIDVVLIAKPELSTLDYHGIARELINTIQKKDR